MICNVSGENISSQAYKERDGVIVALVKNEEENCRSFVRIGINPRFVEVLAEGV